MRWMLRVVLVAAVGATAATASTRSSGSTAQAVSARSPARTVAVTLREFAIIMPAKLRPGPTTFVLHNRGVFPHNFTAIYGPVRFHSRNLAPGTTDRLTVSLLPGVYVIACTILNGRHLAEGMVTRFTIGSVAHGSSHWHYP